MDSAIQLLNNWGQSYSGSNPPNPTQLLSLNPLFPSPSLPSRSAKMASKAMKKFVFSDIFLLGLTVRVFIRLKISENCMLSPTRVNFSPPSFSDELQCSSNGQCPCLSSVTGLRCDSCVSAYYWNPSGQGCVECRCNNVGSVGRNCNDTGYCTCKANIGGRQCDRCVADYYGFTATGRYDID